MRNKREKGFTLIELMIVVAIIGILAAVAIPKFADLIDKAREAKVKASLAGIRSASTIYYGGHEGVVPITLASLVPINIKEIAAGSFNTYTSVNPYAGKSKATWILGAEQVLGAITGTNLMTAGWAYDSTDFDIWINGGPRLDSKGFNVHTW